MPERIFMVYSDTTASTLNLDLTSDLNVNSLTLINYAVDGVPVSSGIPDYLFYNLNFINTSCVMNNPIRNDNVVGFPLMLDATFTTKTLETGWKVIDHPARLSKFTVQLTKPDKSAAVLSRFVLLFMADLA